ncbi:hypothetical protein GUITHDRAFT_165141 [Guillardia theta CCMP2712]|uniref:ZC3H15/TMA46 family C-terminal domain-containing protein n=1 Tax=Guillardia theta (strain CCMP2712) TaxID=905079 RepID=L1IR96_GUITC|nr:hypothetical protein GUITHDRAFT_165141 [Guillardia theta CCMP2712]EKX38627.1 hypothetical protein GUITHDRAFT_165141 [Guillardia theta CCMP2712]|mmetsp:Transcript_32800/g.103746  ORF Transcript_32800/g.103746 Transcript_32800/m.103746 type:complete len:301 (-) Transcript_32800:52-954(-)|eukprot:XP_005825607.1 hypothetical protein GUITHDRAFT_165141 [Guillardia theta CCMP2712]
MPPKASKKEVAKAQKKVIEDKTFGLKNKNKSKVVQNFVQQVTQNAKRAGLSKDEAVRKEKEKEERTNRKAEKEARDAELRMLFAPAVKKKEKEAAVAKKDEAPKEEETEMISAQDAYNEAKRNEDLAKAEAVLGEQKDDDIYDAIERERAELRKRGNLTPVTYDNFVAWKARKAEERKQKDIAEAKKMLAAAKQIKGKSGKDLFNQLAAANADLFLDDDEADDDWMIREKDSDDEEEVYDIQVTGTSFSLQKVNKGGPSAQAESKEDQKDNATAGETELAAAVDASLFLDEDVDLPSDDD